MGWCTDVGKTILLAKDICLLKMITKPYDPVDAEIAKYRKALTELNNNILKLNLCKEHVPKLKVGTKNA